jgi:ABC-type histidine transport system ATPase subunit
LSTENQFADEAVVEMVDVQKHFGELHVLKDINLSVARGEVLVVIGPSGSGKSTLCRTINRLEPIDSGEIRVDGKPLPAEGAQLAMLRAEVGMVFQSFNLFAHKTILDNVTLGPIKVRKTPKDQARAEALADVLAAGVLSSEEHALVPTIANAASAETASASFLFIAGSLLFLFCGGFVPYDLGRPALEPNLFQPTCAFGRSERCTNAGESWPRNPWLCQSAGS